MTVRPQFYAAPVTRVLLATHYVRGCFNAIQLLTYMRCSGGRFLQPSSCPFASSLPDHCHQGQGSCPHRFDAVYCTPPPVITSSPTSVNPRCPRRPWSTTDVCVTHAYMHPLRWRPDHCPTQGMGYNLPGRNLNLGLSVVDPVVISSRIVGIKTRNTFKATALGWAVEWRLFFFPLPPPLRVSDM